MRAMLRTLMVDSAEALHIKFGTNVSMRHKRALQSIQAFARWSRDASYRDIPRPSGIECGKRVRIILRDLGACLDSIAHTCTRPANLLPMQQHRQMYLSSDAGHPTILDMSPSIAEAVWAQYPVLFEVGEVETLSLSSEDDEMAYLGL